MTRSRPLTALLLTAAFTLVLSGCHTIVVEKQDPQQDHRNDNHDDHRQPPPPPDHRDGHQ